MDVKRKIETLKSLFFFFKIVYILKCAFLNVFFKIFFLVVLKDRDLNLQG